MLFILTVGGFNGVADMGIQQCAKNANDDLRDQVSYSAGC